MSDLTCHDASSQPTVDNWQPIETAPKDEVIILCDQRGNRWSGIAPDDVDDRRWLHEGCGYPPTHWQPLPEPPEAGE